MKAKQKNIISKVEVRNSDSGAFWFVALAKNGQVVMASEVYDSHSNARRAAKRIGGQLEVPITEGK